MKVDNETRYKIESALKINEVIIVTKANNTQIIGRVAVVCRKDVEDLGRIGIYAIRCRLPSGYEAWCHAVPATSLMKELV